MTSPTRERPGVPDGLRVAAAYAWRLLLLGVVGYLAVLVLGKLTLLVLPLILALFLTALLHPLDRLLRRLRLPRGLAAIVSVLLALFVFGGVLAFVVLRLVSSLPQLLDQASTVVQQLADAAQKLPFVSPDAGLVDQVQQQAQDYLASNRAQLAGQALTGLRTLLEVLAAGVLTLFFTIYFLYDGDRMSAWVVRLASRDRRLGLQEAAEEAWRRVGGFIRGTSAIASFHGVVIGTTLWLVGAPLVVPLALLVFVGSFIPLIGALLFGGFAVLVALVGGGVGPGLVVLGALLVTNQVEAHVLQPFLMGHYVRLHPVVVAVSVTGGVLLAGIPGAIVAVPLISALRGAVQALHNAPEADLPPDDHGSERLDSETQQTPRRAPEHAPVG